MEEVVLKAKSRSVIGKQVKALRRQGLLPAVIYGHHVEPKPIILDYRDTVHSLIGVTSSQLVTLDIDGSPQKVLVREKQFHPVSGTLLHIDFQQVSMTEKIRVTVSIEHEGESPAVKNYNGVLVTGLEELEIECFPQDLPERIVIDLTKLLEIGDSILVRNIFLPPMINVLNDPDEMVIVVTAPMAEEVLVEEAAPEEVGAEPEVIERGKKEEEEF